MTRYAWLVVLLGFVAASARADEAYTIKFRKDARGDERLVEKSQTTDSSTTIVNAQGKVVTSDERRETTDFVYRETVLEKEGDARPTRLRREYQKAVVSLRGKEKAAPFEGKAVVIERKDDKYTFRYDGGEELKAADAEVLAREFKPGKADTDAPLDELLTPKDPVKVADSWKLDMEAFVKGFARESDLEGDASKATGSAKLTRVYTKDGARYGVLEVRVEIPLKSLGPAAANVTLQPGSKATLDGTLDACIDGSASLGTMKMNIKFNIDGTIKGPDGQELKLTGDVKSVSEETRKPAPKK